MAGYRVGIDLALPAFDTYHCLERLARYPNDRQTRLAHRQLVRRAEQELLSAAAVGRHSIEAVRAALSLRTGISTQELADNMLPDTEDGQTMPDVQLDKLTAAEWVDVYKSLCEAFGDPVDLSSSVDGTETSEHATIWEKTE